MAVAAKVQSQQQPASRKAPAKRQPAQKPETRDQALARMLVVARERNLRGILANKEAGIYIVESSRAGENGHIVTLDQQPACDCPGYENHGYCTHLAVALHMAGRIAAVEAAQGEVVPDEVQVLAAGLRIESWVERAIAHYQLGALDAVVIADAIISGGLPSDPQARKASLFLAAKLPVAGHEAVAFIRSSRPVAVA